MRRRVRGTHCGDDAGMNLHVGDFGEPVLGSRICIRKFDDVNGWALDFRLQNKGF